VVKGRDLSSYLGACCVQKILFSFPAVLADIKKQVEDKPFACSQLLP
jgi:hypothetical protein